MKKGATKKGASSSSVDPPPPEGYIDKPKNSIWAIASNDGILYLGDKPDGMVWWGLNTGEDIYTFHKDDNVNDYVNVGPEENDIEMYRYTSDGGRELIRYGIDEEKNLQEYLEKAYPETTITASIVVKHMYVDYNLGYFVPASNKALLVIRKDYTLHKNSPKSWFLKYAKFEVVFPAVFDHDKESRVECVVRHTWKYTDFCQVYNKYWPRLPTKSTTGLEIPLNKLLSSCINIKIPYRAPIFAHGNNKTIFVLGEFNGIEVVVKKVNKSTWHNSSSAIENYFLVSNHENIVNLYTCESEGEIFKLAMEKCKRSLAAHVEIFKLAMEKCSQATFTFFVGSRGQYLLYT